MKKSSDALFAVLIGPRKINLCAAFLNEVIQQCKFTLHYARVYPPHAMHIFLIVLVYCSCCDEVSARRNPIIRRSKVSAGFRAIPINFPATRHRPHRELNLHVVSLSQKGEEERILLRRRFGMDRGNWRRLGTRSTSYLALVEFCAYSLLILYPEIPTTR